MIELKLKQGSEEWHKARLGIPTSSQFHRIITKGGAPSKSNYAHELIAEKLLGYPVTEFVSDWMQRGQDLEDRAVAFYELQRDRDTSTAGFCLTDDRKAGASPDRFVGDLGLLEIKCPSPIVHVGNMLNLTDGHKQQTQAQLMVTGREWVDLLSYHPDLPPALVRVNRNEIYIEAMKKHLAAFLTGLEEMFEKVNKDGGVPL